MPPDHTHIYLTRHIWRSVLGCDRVIVSLQGDDESEVKRRRRDEAEQEEKKKMKNNRVTKTG